MRTWESLHILPRTFFFSMIGPWTSVQKHIYVTLQFSFLQIVWAFFIWSDKDLELTLFFLVYGFNQSSPPTSFVASILKHIKHTECSLSASQPCILTSVSVNLDTYLWWLVLTLWDTGYQPRGIITRFLIQKTSEIIIPHMPSIMSLSHIPLTPGLTQGCYSMS